MCGRYEMVDKGDLVENLSKRLKKANKTFKIGEIFPSDNVAAIINQNGKITLEVLKWNYGKDRLNKPVINARSETVITKPFFKDDFINRRCLLLMTGFYEWSPSKVKHFYTYKTPLFLGGIYSKDLSFTILTKDAIEPISLTHNRMPILLTPEDAQKWLINDKFAKDYIKIGFVEPLIDQIV